MRCFFSQAILFLLGCVMSVKAQTPAILASSDADSGDGFGAAISLSGNLLLVGAPSASHTSADNREGAAYIFRHDGIAWIEEQRLVAQDPDSSDSFGNSVVITDTLAVIGARLDDEAGENSGAVYVFAYRHESWHQIQKLTADVIPGDFFGSAVAIDSSRIYVGTTEASTHRDGVVFVFSRNAGFWTEDTTLRASNPRGTDFFGATLFALNGQLMVTAPQASMDFTRRTGSVYQFSLKNGSWAESFIFEPPDGMSADFFGRSVFYSGSYLLVGAPLQEVETNGTINRDQGSVYVYRQLDSMWTQVARLTASDGARIDVFGTAVCLFRDHIIVGAPRVDDADEDAGALYVYSNQGDVWTEQKKIVPPEITTETFFGAPLACDEQIIVVGARNYQGHGAVFLYDETTLNISGVRQATTPTAYELFQNYPNPFNPETAIRFDYPEGKGGSEKAKILIHNSTGQLIATLHDNIDHTGSMEISWNGRTSSGTLAPSGIYFYTLELNDFRMTKKMLLMR